MFHQRPSYDKIGLGYLLGEKSTKKYEIRIEADSIAKIPKEEFKWSDEVEKIELTKKFDEPRTIEQVEEPKQDDSSKEVRHEFRGRCFICNEVGHMKRDCTCNYFRPFTNFYYYKILTFHLSFSFIHNIYFIYSTFKLYLLFIYGQ